MRQTSIPFPDARGAPQPCQRWTDGRDSYRPAGEPIDARRFGVEPIPEGQARGFVVRHHYSATYPSARARVGLFRSRGAQRPELVGVAVFSVGVQPAAIRAHLGVDVDPDALDRAVLEVRTAESIGPILDPTAWARGPNAKNAEHYQKILSTTATLVRALRAAKGAS